jgi:hypothetical protein
MQADYRLHPIWSNMRIRGPVEVFLTHVVLNRILRSISILQTLQYKTRQYIPNSYNHAELPTHPPQSSAHSAPFLATPSPAQQVSTAIQKVPKQPAVKEQ